MEDVTAEVANIVQPQSVKPKRFKSKQLDIYMTNVITRQIALPMHRVGKNIKNVLENLISNQIEGKCVAEGYIRKGSTKILTYSSGVLKADNVIFEVVFECQVCSLVEGMKVKVIAKNITKAGIRAETDENPSPIVVFVARDHHVSGNKSAYFSSIKTDETIEVRVIGQRYELNDKYISVIAELIEPYTEKAKGKKKPRIELLKVVEE
jgi:hypothetical protein